MPIYSLDLFTSDILYDVFDIEILVRLSLVCKNLQLNLKQSIEDYKKDLFIYSIDFLNQKTAIIWGKGWIPHILYKHYFIEFKTIKNNYYITFVNISYKDTERALINVINAYYKKNIIWSNLNNIKDMYFLKDLI
tara:strand:- start:1896 stop:2300 length:405 start_codon:yes stop_codon:yes gene_type:complete